MTDPLFSAALANFQAAQSKKKAPTGVALTNNATKLLEQFKKTDADIAAEEKKIEEALESEDKKKLTALLAPGALPALEANKPAQHKVCSLWNANEGQS